ncbi:MAG: UDP-N-acetylmuramyl-tripeptide synthetase [Tissierellia bacterium]|nr:UDP-N-acetylmuramyl-tripeptide synthetase [Tissierellia bacterium]
MNIQNLLEGVEILESWGHQEDLEVQGVNYNSKKIQEGDVFVAIKGLITDGHKYISDALDRGAVAVVVTEKPEKIQVPTYLVPSTRKALAQISANYYNHPSKEMTMIGITASNGKTSTSMMLRSILDAAGEESGLIGTVMYKIRDVEIPSKLTTPESLELQGLFREMREEDLPTVVMEVSSISQEMCRVHGVDFDIVCMNNITREHIDQHGSFEQYFEQKKRLITEAKPDAFVILNLSDPVVKTLIDQTPGRLITFSDVDAEADIYAEDIDLSTGFPKFTLVVRRDFMTRGGRATIGRYPVTLQVAGYHSLVNSLSAMAMAIAMGIPMEEVIRGMEAFKGIERRFQQVYNQEFKIVDDHFANMGNIDMTLQTLSMMTYEKLHLVYAIRGNRGVTVNGENADKLIEWNEILHYDSLIASLSRDCVEDHDVVHPDELQIFQRKLDEGKLGYELTDTLREAVTLAVDRAGEGDLILLAGCQGMDFGAKYILEAIQAKYPEKDPRELFAVLEDRVAGI